MKENPWSNWRHITKLDPDKPLSDEDVRAVADSGTDAIMISGTQNVTLEKVNRLVSVLKDYEIPKVLEPSGSEHVIYEGIDHVFVPSVINAQDIAWVTGKHIQWIKNSAIEWEKVVPEAYIVLNPDSAVGMVTKSKTDLTMDEIIAYAKLADRYFNFPIFYIEYSGTYGNPEVVKAVKENLENSTLFYGGGITDGEKAGEMSAHADTIIVGNVLYEQGVEKLKETIDAVRR
ncbi:MAG: phosphoglycerol geranylgeranyltransferase [Candidatus Altiarchaeales archaeon]|nr:phosphoglycerol geranylgeranyltransferase [Candidatus Altiarchaeota archaeon]MBU4341071.1 phosphoglycerol geranylgeranyltransferase [Candidatus Altiarchaeota archaeon]MBU4437508.1 phosphoglycerol geranylgeranyltransferase [Candidatus Altiarchaeota archaeon]MCG2782359.1 phosphoglycerol geranylgeranyltransferase [Candidatus Altiarchaeales archaeon]